MPAEYSHLEVFVEKLVKLGNTVRTPFSESQAGWWCQLDKPLDTAECSRAAAADQTITFDADDDAPFCRHCWTMVYGGGHLFPSRLSG